MDGYFGIRVTYHNPKYCHICGVLMLSQNILVFEFIHIFHALWHSTFNLYETSTWHRQWSANKQFNRRCQLHNIYLSSFVSFSCIKKSVWNLAQTQWDSFIWQALGLLIFLMCHTCTAVRPFLLNLNLYSFSLRSWRFCLGRNDTFTTTNKCRMSLLHGWQCEGLVRCDWIVHCHGNTRHLFHHPSKQARRKWGKETGEKIYSQWLTFCDVCM